jgi:glycerophosphoryl diester phosphodiesterase
MLVIAHRGFSSQYTQNTADAFAQALLLDIDAIELDIHQVEDEFMVFHDPYVNKLTNGKGRIFDMSLSEVRQLLINDKDPIPTLSQIAALVGNQVILNIEVKSLQSVKQFVDYVKNIIETYQCQVLISSFDHPVLMAVKASFTDFTEHAPFQTSPAQRFSSSEKALSSEKSPLVEFGALIAHSPFDHAKYASSLGVSVAATDWNTVNADFVEDAHKRGMKVWCYTVNHEETLLELMAMGVDGIFTDRPDWAKQVINSQVP